MKDDKKEEKIYSPEKRNFPERVDGTFLQDELDIFLAANGLKPAALVGIAAYLYDKPKEYLTDEDIERFSEFLEELGLNYKIKEITTKPAYAEKIEVEFIVGKNKKDLEQLDHAKNDEEIGIALGYPEEAAKAYGKPVDGIVRIGSYTQVREAEAEKTNISPPIWLAYMGHVPKYLELAEDKVSESSKCLSEEYQNFTRKYNPKLADRIEKQHSERKMPDDWKLDEKGKYWLFFKEFGWI